MTEFYIGEENATGLEFTNREEFFERLNAIVDERERNGDTLFSITIETSNA